jgi:hypothetical protein
LAGHNNGDDGWSIAAILLCGTYRGAVRRSHCLNRDFDRG